MRTHDAHPSTPHRPRSRRTRLVVTGSVAAAAVITAAGSLATASTPADPGVPATRDSTHAQVLAQGVMQVGNGDHQWVLEAFDVAGPIEVPASGPTFILPTTAAVRVLGAGGAGLGSAVEAGESVFVPAGEAHQLSLAAAGAASGAASVLEVGVTGGAGLGTFALTEGLYDVELVRDVLAGGEQLPVTGATSAILLVTAGAVTLPGQGVLPAGYNLPLNEPFTVVNEADAPAAVLVATVSPLDAPVIAGAALPNPVGAAGPPPLPSGTPIVGNSTPGTTTPTSPTDGSTPGTTAPGGAPIGNTTPGNTTPGTTTPGATTPDGGQTPTTVGTGPTTPPTQSPPTSPPTTEAPPTTQPPQQGEGPLSLQLVSCSPGQTLSIRVDASAGDGYRRNVQSITVSRQNNEGAYTSPWNMLWIGEDTAEHDEWSTVGQVTGQNQNMGDGMIITARSAGGQVESINTTMSASC